jgi:hypothetical protein
MDYPLVPRSLDLPAHRFGRPQQSGPLTMVPLFGPDADGRFTPPLSGLKLGGVRGYGNVELHNPSPSGVAIVPLHIGYIQDQAQNHALCGSAFLGAGQKRLFDDACCVQQAQGGYLESKEQWFFVLPLALRDEALALRGQKNFGKLWPAITRLNQRFGLEARGHLEQLICRKRPVLTQYQSRLELLPGQTGALFFLGDRLAGVEIAPGAAYFREVWMPLVCFCYGTAAQELERVAPPLPAPEPLAARSLPELRERLAESRAARLHQVSEWLARTPAEQLRRQEEERYLDLRLFTATGEHYSGQFVEENDRLLYASLTARPGYLAGASCEPSAN